MIVERRTENANPYDLYIAAHVDEMKAENAYLWRRVRQLCGENAELSRMLDQRRRAECYEEKDWKWMDG